MHCGRQGERIVLFEINYKELSFRQINYCPSEHGKHSLEETFVLTNS